MLLASDPHPRFKGGGRGEDTEIVSDLPPSVGSPKPLKTWFPDWCATPFRQFWLSLGWPHGPIPFTPLTEDEGVREDLLTYRQ